MGTFGHGRELPITGIIENGKERDKRNDWEREQAGTGLIRKKGKWGKGDIKKWEQE